MALIDISISVSPSTAEWPGDTPFSCGWTWDMSKGSSVNVSTITMSPHVGTHADAPVHVRAGADGAELLPLDAFYGAAVVIDVSDLNGALSFDQIMDRVALVREGSEVPSRLLLKTGRTIAAGKFPETWPALSPDCAKLLANRGVVLLGVDCPSVDDRESKTLDVHHALFDNGAYVLENLDLREAQAGQYNLIALPLRLEQLDAAPVRAVLTDIEGHVG